MSESRAASAAPERYSRTHFKENVARILTTTVSGLCLEIENGALASDAVFFSGFRSLRWFSLSGSDFPYVASAEKFCDIAFAALGLHFLNLCGDNILVAREMFPRAQDADRSGEAGQISHVR